MEINHTYSIKKNLAWLNVIWLIECTNCTGKLYAIYTVIEIIWSFLLIKLIWKFLKIRPCMIQNSNEPFKITLIYKADDYAL